MDPQAETEFLHFVANASPALLRAAYTLTGHQQAAEDLVQTALERVALRWSKMTDPHAYARRVMYHEHISWWRRFRRREFPVAEHFERAAPGDLSGTVALRADLRSALALLGPRQRAVLVLRFLEDRSVEEVAELLGCSAGTVRSQTSRALSRIRDLTSLPGAVSETGVER